jgi:hypothetical protein
MQFFSTARLIENRQFYLSKISHGNAAILTFILILAFCITRKSIKASISLLQIENGAGDWNRTHVSFPQG